MSNNTNNTLCLRSVSLYDRGVRLADGTIALKAGEPGQAGKVYSDATQVAVVGKLQGDMLCVFPDGELAYVSKNKVAGSKAAADYAASKGKRVTVAKATKIDPMQEIAEARAALEALLAKAEAKRQAEIAAARAVLEKHGEMVSMAGN